MFMISMTRLPWMVAYLATLGVLALAGGALLHADLYGGYLITSAITLAVVKPVDEKQAQKEKAE